MRVIKHHRLPTCTGWTFHIFPLGSRLCLRCKCIATKRKV